MIRGTTPTLNFTLPFASSEISTLSIAFAQQGRTVIEKQLSDCTQDENVLTVRLTQAETLSLNSVFAVEIQIRCLCGETALASNIINTSVGRILKEGVLGGD